MACGSLPRDITLREAQHVSSRSLSEGGFLAATPPGNPAPSRYIYIPPDAVVSQDYSRFVEAARPGAR